MLQIAEIKRWSERRAVLESNDFFVGCVHWGNWRAVTVYRREHAGRIWVRLRTWNKHRQKCVWYPTKRFYVIPIEHAAELAGTLCAAVGGLVQTMPDWLIDFQGTQLRRLNSLGLSEEQADKAAKRIVGA